MIRGGGGKSSGYSADLMVCFPTRTHLSLPSKSISSPSSALNRRQSAPPPPPHHHRRSFSKLSGSGGVRQSRVREMAEEPTSPKVTCAGQIKVRPSKRGGGKNWQSLMAEIEKIHRSKSESKFLGIKKDVMGFLTCLRDFDFRCFGAFPPVDAVSDQEEEEEEEEEEEDDEDEEDGGSVMKTYSGTVFSNWLTFLHEKQNVEEVSDNVETAVPPPNALLLMRCRSAPVKNWLETEREKKVECEDTKKQSGEEEKETVSKKKDLRSLMEEEEEENNVNMVVRDYDTNYYKLSSDIAKETWVVGGFQDSLYRSRSWNN